MIANVLSPNHSTGDRELGERRPFRVRYGLRTFFVFVAVVGVFLGWIGLRQHRARVQRGAVEAIVKLGGQVRYDYHRTDDRTNVIDYRRPQIPQFLLSIFGDDMFCQVVEVSLSHNAELTNDDLVHLRSLPHLKTLFLCGGEVTGDGLYHLCNFHDLEDLTLGIPLTDDDLHYLASIKSLKEIYLLGPRPSDFMVRLRGPTLIYDDQSHNSNVTENGIQTLASELKGCRITY